MVEMLMARSAYSLYYFVPNFEECVCFYRDVLALPVKHDQTQPGGRRRVVFEWNRRARLELLEPRPDDVAVWMPALGMHLELETADAAALFQRLVQHRAVVLTPLNADMDGRMWFTVQAPDGLTIQVRARGD